MITMNKPTAEPCFVCGTTHDSVEVNVQGREVVLCWKDARKIFKSRSSNRPPQKPKHPNEEKEKQKS